MAATESTTPLAGQAIDGGRTAHHSGRTYRILLLIWLIFIIMIVGSTAVGVQHLRRIALASSEQDMRNLGAVLAEQTSRSIQSLDIVLRGIQMRVAELGIQSPDALRQQMAGGNTRNLLGSYLQNLPQAESVILIDAQGSLLNWSQDAPVPAANFSDRDYFHYFSSTPATNLFITRPQPGRISGKWVMLIVRRLSAPDGTFLGLVAGLIDMQYLEDFYRTISTTSGQSVTVLRRDGIVLAGQPDIGQWRGRRIPDTSPWYDSVAHGGGSYIAPDYLDGVATIVTVHPLRDYPLVINANLSEAAALATWRQDSSEIILARSGIALSFTALFGLIALQFRRQDHHAAELARAAEKLQASERQLRDFAEISSDWFWEQDAELRFRWLSTSAVFNQIGDHSYVGRTRWELAGQEATEPAWQGHKADLDARRPFRDFRYQVRSKDGKLHHFSTSGFAVFDDAGVFLGYHGTARDITAEVEVAEELRRSKEAAEAANRAKSEFLANMSHELRTPLHAIIGFSELMCDQRSGRIGGDYIQWAGDIMASGRHLLDVINDVLELARIEAGRYVLADDRFDIAIAVRACLGMVRLQAEAKRIDLDCTIADREVMLRADSRAVRQIVLNLLTNAVKFTPSGGVVSIRCELPSNGNAVLVVSDTGIGIDALALASLGEPFTQADSSISRTYGGTGLGLSISRRLVAMHGGELAIQSAPGKGTVVRVTFPATRVVVVQQPALMLLRGGSGDRQPGRIGIRPLS